MPTDQKTQKIILISAILGSSMASIDGTALNVAMPALQRSLSLTANQLLWVINAYTLFLAALVLLGGSLGDTYGKKKMFLTGIIFFTIFSISCGFAQSGEMLIISRALQGIGAAFMIPGSLSIISAAYPQETRGGAIGSWSMFSAFTTLLGPVLGGYLASQGLWRYIFFINIPLGIVCILLLWKIPEPAKKREQKIDWLGALLVTLGLSSLTYGCIGASEKGFDDIYTLVFIGLGLVLLFLFLVWERKTAYPILPLGLFKSQTFSAANLLTLFVYGALGAVLFFLPLNLVQVQGYSENIAGFALLPFAGLIAILARFSGKWTDKTGAKPPLIVGPILTAIGFYSFSLMGETSGPDAYFSTFFLPLLISGIGMGLTVVPLTTAVMNCVNDESTGVASGVNNTISRLASVLALAILGSFLVISFKTHLNNNLVDQGFDQPKLEYVDMEADKLLEAKALDNWAADEKRVFEKALSASFLSAYELICTAAGMLCLISAVVAAFFIKTNPRTIELK
jgi:EmrB/QacA subfamily drug resistance transporter